MWSTVGEALRIIVVVSIGISAAIGIYAIVLEAIDRRHHVNELSRGSEASIPRP